MADLRLSKTKRNKSTVNKSNTVVMLPGIMKTFKNSDTERKPIKPTYIQTISNISDNVEYGDKNSSYLMKQQSKLKQILRKMNNDTLSMIDNIRPRKNIIKQPKQELQIIADKQIQNSRKNIAIMQIQIQKLQERYTKIVQFGQEEVVSSKIKEVRNQIVQLTGHNLSIKLGIEKDSKDIIRQYSDDYDFKLTAIENDKIVLDQRLSKLQVETNRIDEENVSLLSKIKEIDRKIEQCTEQYESIIQNNLSNTLGRNRESTYRQRKYQLELITKKSEMQQNQLRYKYYRLLKELQFKKGTLSQLSSKQQPILDTISRTKENINSFQAILSVAIKKKQQASRLVFQYLQNQRRNRQFSEGGNLSTFIQKEPSSIQSNQKYQIKTETIDGLRKWQSSPLDEASQKSIQQLQKVQIGEINLTNSLIRDKDVNIERIKSIQKVDISNTTLTDNKQKIGIKHTQEGRIQQNIKFSI